MSRFCGAHRLPRAGVDPIDDAVAALAVIRLASTARRSTRPSPSSSTTTAAAARSSWSTAPIEPDSVLDVVEHARRDRSPRPVATARSSSPPCGRAAARSTATTIAGWRPATSPTTPASSWSSGSCSTATRPHVESPRPARGAAAMVTRQPASGPGAAPGSAAARRRAGGASSSRLLDLDRPRRHHRRAVLLGDVVVVALEAAPRDADCRRRSRAARRSDSSLTMWHQRRPRCHHSGSSMSTATAAVWPASPAGRLWKTGPHRRRDGAARGVDRGGRHRPARRSPRSTTCVGRHREPHRRYHGVRHVTWVVRHVHELAGDGRGRRPRGGHDGRVLPRRRVRPARRRQRGAERVARRARARRARLGRRPGARRRRADPGHRAPRGRPTSRTRRCSLDADLAVLGSEPAAYQAYVTGVRAEYAHVDDARLGASGAPPCCACVPRPAAPVLHGRRPRERWEARARANMAAELASLG